MSSKNVKKKLIWQTISAVLIIVVLIVLLVIQYTQFWSLKIKENQLKNQLELLQEEHYIFEQEYNYKSSDQFVEDYAHQVLGWGKSGESYYEA